MSDREDISDTELEMHLENVDEDAAASDIESIISDGDLSDLENEDDTAMDNHKTNGTSEIGNGHFSHSDSDSNQSMESENFTDLDIPYGQKQDFETEELNSMQEQGKELEYDDDSDLDFPDFRELLLKSLIPEPIVFKGIHKKWRAVRMDLAHFDAMISDKVDGLFLECRTGVKEPEVLANQWESSRRIKYLRWKDFVNWDKSKQDPKSWICYDYKNLKDALYEEYLEDFNWSQLGFPERDGKESNLWIGTAGSFTPCHYDTYGSNLICQVKGRKRWILFPPKDSEYLYPTRVPYEESSVYSQINFSSPSLSTDNNEELKKCSPVSVVLQPGDVLYVPPKWWHYVRTQEFSISVNTWIGLPEDHESRLDEAIIRSVVGSFVSIAPVQNFQNILNPNEEAVIEMTANEVDVMLQRTTDNFLKSIESHPESVKNDETLDKKETTEPAKKKARFSVDLFQEFFDRHSDVILKLPSHNFDLPLELSECENSNGIEIPCEENSDVPVINITETEILDEEDCPAPVELNYFTHLINAIGHPDIIGKIRKQFLINIQMATTVGKVPVISPLEEDQEELDSVEPTNEVEEV